MVSLMNNGDSEISAKPDSIGEPSEDVKSRIFEERDGDERSPGSRGSNEARVLKMELDSRDLGSEDGSRVSEEGRVEREVKKESDGGEVGEETEAKASEVKVESPTAEDEVEEEEEEEDDEEDEEEEEEGDAVKRTGSQFNSLMSEFDDFVANENGGQMAASRALRYGFEVGDMVWGKVKSHPWWPGHIFSDAFASPQVRRTRREGHVLVAFFGDSSYGWFDPAEFIAFDANFAEKSRQTSSRNFTKAVDEAVDEVSRRRALGLACKCRNSQSFLPAGVQGYFVVDVPDYEPRAVYSAKQIQKARDSFKPQEALSFIKNLALSPCVGNDKDLEFMKNRATVVAYRKAVFEEHDVTYAQAFGVQPGRRAPNQADLPDQAKLPPRAPLSGPLVIAETLGGDKRATKEKKIKDGTKKDKYLLKRRDESSNLKKAHQVSQGKLSSTAPLASVEASVAVGDGNFLSQKITSDAPLNPENVSKTAGDSSICGSEAVIANQASASHSLADQDATIDTKPSLDKGKAMVVSDGIPISKGTDSSDLLGNATVKTDGALQSLKGEGQDSAEFKHEESQQPQPIFTAQEDGHHGTCQVQDAQSVEGLVQSGVKHSSRMNKISGIKKSKVKRLREEPDADNPTTERKKKKKKQLDTEKSSGEPKKHSVSKSVGSSTGKIMGKAARTSLATKEALKTEQNKRIVAISNNLSDSAGTLPMGSIGNEELELPRLLSDLQTLALDPFHGMERSSPAVVRKFFLRFRSLVYQKSLALSPPPEAESAEARPSKFPANVGAADNNSTEPVRDIASPKLAKPSFRSEDPTIAGRKRSSSDRLEDIAAKRAKKISDIKTLAAEKKTSQKTSEAYRSGEGRESAVPLGRRTKPNSAKKSEPPARAVDPTMLVMKFPPKTSLPSPAELKARFARFGPIDQSGLRVFWKSSTCRIVFLHKSDAQAACKYAAANSSILGMPGMRCYVKEYGAGGPEVPETGKPQGIDDNPTDTQRTKDSNSHRPPPATVQPPLPLPQPALQLKSCLKKSAADESGPLVAGIGGGNTRGTPRVKFMLAGEENTSTTSRVEPSIAGNRNNNNSASFSDGGALVSSTSTTSVAMDFSVRNIQKVVPSPLPILPLPPQFAKPTLNNNSHHQQNHHPHHHSDAMMMMGPRNTQNPNTSYMGAPPSTTTNSVDISQQMLSLLTRCNDVVTNVTGLLGYVPYHPL